MIPRDAISTPGGSLVRVVRYAPGERHAPHAHSRTSVTLVVRGGLDERVGPATERGSSLSVVVKPAGIEHADAFGDDGAVTLQVILSHADAARADEAGTRLGAWRWIHAGPATRILLGLLHAVVDEANGPAPPSTIAALLFAGVGAIDPVRRPAARPPDWLVETRRALETGPVPVRGLAAAHGIHPVHLARAFRRHFGLSPSAFRRRARLRRAAGWVTRGTLPLCEAAIAAGYADQAHMTRELRRGAGVTPRGLRAIASRL